MAYKKTPKTDAEQVHDSIKTTRAYLIRKGLSALNKNELIDNLVAGSFGTTSIIRNLFGGTGVFEIENLLADEKARHKRATAKISELFREKRALEEENYELRATNERLTNRLGLADGAIQAKNALINNERLARGIPAADRLRLVREDASKASDKPNTDTKPLAYDAASHDDATDSLNFFKDVLGIDFDKPQAERQASAEAATVRFVERLTDLIKQTFPEKPVTDNFTIGDREYRVVAPRVPSDALTDSAAVQAFIGALDPDNFPVESVITIFDMAATAKVVDAEDSYPDQTVISDLLAQLVTDTRAGGYTTKEGSNVPVLVGLVWNDQATYKKFIEQARSKHFSDADIAVLAWTLGANFGKPYPIAK